MGAVGQVRVAFKETITSVIDRPQSAPTSQERVIQAIYQACPAAFRVGQPQRHRDRPEVRGRTDSAGVSADPHRA